MFRDGCTQGILIHYHLKDAWAMKEFYSVTETVEKSIIPRGFCSGFAETEIFFFIFFFHDF